MVDGALKNDAEYASLLRSMLNFAQLQLRDHAAAEDAVQEALVAALDQRKNYRGEASYRTWVFAILKRKVIDIIRQRQRSVPVSAWSEEGQTLDETLEQLFVKHSHWAPQHKPRAWDAPDELLENKQFWEVFEACLIHLPDNTARVFMMREFLELETNEICEELHISMSNCHVILHRARHTLRRCLDTSWFGRSPSC